MRGKVKTFTPAPEGNHVAIVTQVIDLGTQDTEWGVKSRACFGSHLHLRTGT